MKRFVMYTMALVFSVVSMCLMSTSLLAGTGDDNIAAAFQKTYVYKTYLVYDDVKAESKDGVVTLTGTVADENHKTLAEEAAANLTGVTRVDNQLVTKQEAAGNNKDDKIARNVKLTLLFHRNVNWGKTTVEVKDGVVTLTGEASSIAQKDLTTEYATDIEGVKEVKNEMTVVTPSAPAEPTVATKIDDASITAQVKTALMTHRSTSATKTAVKTKDGEVTLTGIAKNAAEKSLVTKLVTDIQGVTAVNNQMTLE